MSGKIPGKGAGVSGDHPAIRFGPITLDVATRRVVRADVELHLTPKAFDLLAILVGEAPRVVPKAELHERLWPSTFVSDATLVSLIKELRRALDTSGQPRSLIRTAHGVGYALAVPTERLEFPQPTDVWHWVDANGRHIRLLDGENLIGRDPTCRVWLDIASVSRRHARISLDRGDAWLEDLGSKNRTKLGSAAIAERTCLNDGDRIQVGAILLVYRRSRGGMPTETQPDV